MNNIKSKFSKLPFRKGVQAYIVNNKNELLLINGHKLNPFWKPPSGGMELNETPEQTVVREMKEELGVKVKIVKKCSFMNTFLWPENIIKEFHYKFKGQKQYVIIVKIKPNQKIKPDKKEIYEYRWIPFEKVNQYLSLRTQRQKFKEVLKEYKKLKN